MREVRAQSSICFSALPDVDVSGLLKEIIKENVYRKDYENLTIQLLEENISYDMAIEALKKIDWKQVFWFLASPKNSTPPDSIGIGPNFGVGLLHECGST